MASPRRRQVITLVVIIAIVGSVIFTLHALRSTSGMTNSNNAVVCQQRLSWVRGDANASLLSIIALSKQNAWAVGQQGQSVVIEHWDGHSWNTAQLPVLATTSSLLTTIAAVNATDIWAVGSAGQQPLILHWNGVTWAEVNAAPVNATSSQFSSLAIVSADDVWAMGSASQGMQSSTPYLIAQHWDGHSWQTAPTPREGSFAAISANNAGAVWGLVSTTGLQQYIVRWNGHTHTWQQVASPPSNNYQGMAVANDGTVWVAGSYQTSDDLTVVILEHWRGSAWSQTQAGELESRVGEVANLALASDGSVWVAGSIKNPNTRLFDAFALHIEGKSAGQYLYPNVYSDPHNGDSFSVTGVAAVPGANAAWVIGSMGSVPNAYLPPIDSNLPVASGGFTLAYC